jgi:hypothetical protein
MTSRLLIQPNPSYNLANLAGHQNDLLGIRLKSLMAVMLAALPPFFICILSVFSYNAPDRY